MKEHFYHYPNILKKNWKIIIEKRFIIEQKTPDSQENYNEIDITKYTPKKDENIW